MPKHPQLSGPAGAMPASIFARLYERLACHQGEVFPFHIGDTHLEPPEASRLDALSWQDASVDRLYRYGAPAGDPRLVGAVIDKLRARNGIDVMPSQVQITAGATHAFACAARALLDPGDEVLLLAPYWPLIRGHVISVGARPVEVPFSSVLLADATVDPAALLAPYVTPRTVGLYLINPNNPDGMVLGPRELSAIAELARSRDLWVLADEVYEDFAFDGRAHTSIATRPGMAERTLTIFSFSKSYAQAGLRVGYVVGPEGAIDSVRKLANHSVYNVPRAMQRAALAALETGGEFLANARAEYRCARDEAVARVPLPCAVPQGGSYLFLDLTPRLAPGEDSVALLERLAGEGILLAPGAAFGEAFGRFARLCYTAVPRARLVAGLAKMAAVLGG